MEYKYNVGDNLIFDNGVNQWKCKVLKPWQLTYKNEFPTYRVELGISEDMWGYPKYIIAPECMLHYE